MCWLCRAGNKVRSWRDFRQQAPWRGTILSHLDYLGEVGVGNLPKVFLIQGFKLECVLIDAMHCIDLGVAAHILGNIFYEMSLLPALGKNQSERVAKLWALMDAWYKKNRVDSRLSSPLSVEDFKQSKTSPKFRAKAAQTRHLVPFVVELCVQHCVTDLDKHRLACVTSLASLYGLMETCERCPSKETEKEFARQGYQLITFYCALHEAYGPERWKLTPKLHLLDHLLHLQVPRWGNPRHCWCYSDEDLVGQVMEVARSCHPSTTPEIALFKFATLHSMISE